MSLCAVLVKFTRTLSKRVVSRYPTLLLSLELERKDTLRNLRFFRTGPNVLNKKFNVCVEGNIGSGKTTFIEHFKALEGFVEVHEEPVKQWRNLCNENPLAKLYEDPSRWAFTFQSYVTLTLLQLHFQEQNKPVRMLERSVYSARYFFTENLYRNGHLTQMEYEILCKWFDWEMDQHPINIDLMIYIRTSPEICQERTKARQRPEEQIISLQYLKDLHLLHERFLVKGDYYQRQKPRVLVLDGDHDKKTMESTFQDVVKEMWSKLGISPRQNPITLAQPTDSRQNKI